MSFLLKIVEGPNKGAEAALPDGVAVTLGKSDDCDIVLADPTLPDEPLACSVSAEGVSIGGERLEPLQVKTFGATSFAVGPDDQPWGELKWPGRETNGQETEDERREEEDSSRVSRPAPEERPAPDAPAAKKRRGGCLGCAFAFLVFVAALLALGWFFRDTVRPCAGKTWRRVSQAWQLQADGAPSADGGKPAPAEDGISALAARYGLSWTNMNGAVALTGNFATRVERLVATAGAYAARPGIELDFSDDETLRTAAEDTLSLLGESGLRVVAATNRVLAFAGRAANLRRALDALRADIPRLRSLDVSGVTAGAGIAGAGVKTLDDIRETGGGASNIPRLASKTAEPPRLALPVCGILTTPYPCLVLRNGMRIMEGAPVGDSVVVEIAADSVTLTNATGRFTWRP